jgi:hypothetical protein
MMLKGGRVRPLSLVDRLDGESKSSKSKSNAPCVEQFSSGTTMEKAEDDGAASVKAQRKKAGTPWLTACHTRR